MDRRHELDITREQLRRRNLSGAAAASISVQQKSISRVLQISRLLDNSDPVVREGAIKSLESIGGRDASTLIMRSLRDPDPRVRATACGSLGKMRAHTAKGHLYDCLNDTDAVVCCRAASALSMMGDKVGLAHVQKLIFRPGRHHREAISSLNLIAGTKFPVNSKGLKQAVRWLRAQRKHFKF